MPWRAWKHCSGVGETSSSPVIPCHLDSMQRHWIDIHSWHVPEQTQKSLPLEISLVPRHASSGCVFLRVMNLKLGGSNAWRVHVDVVTFDCLLGTLPSLAAIADGRYHHHYHHHQHHPRTRIRIEWGGMAWDGLGWGRAGLWLRETIQSVSWPGSSQRPNPSWHGLASAEEKQNEYYHASSSLHLSNILSRPTAPEAYLPSSAST